jgi:hypothetical protein
VVLIRASAASNDTSNRPTMLAPPAAGQHMTLVTRVLESGDGARPRGMGEAATRVGLRSGGRAGYCANRDLVMAGEGGEVVAAAVAI